LTTRRAGSPMTQPSNPPARRGDRPAAAPGRGEGPEPAHRGGREHVKTTRISHPTAALTRALALLLVLAAPTAFAADPFLRRTATVRVVERVGPSVVNITTERLQAQPSPFTSNRQPELGPLSDE